MDDTKRARRYSSNESSDEELHRREKHSRRRIRDGDDDRRGHRRRDHRGRSRSVERSMDESKRPSKDWDYRQRSRSRERPNGRSRSPPSNGQRFASPPRRSKAPLPSQDESFRGEVGPSDKPAVEKQKPNFKPTGLLAKEANTVAGTTTVLKYHEPAEARKPPPKEQWRLYVFKGKDIEDTVYLHQRSAWLMGRDQKVTDLLLEHPSISKQHAVIQFRHLTTTNEYGDKLSKVKPYLIDLGSANGTSLNGKKIEASRYFELVDQDVLLFGYSPREYVVMLPPP